MTFICKAFRKHGRPSQAPFILALALVLMTVSIAQAYIPNSRTIVGRLTRTTGKGLYSIEQEVQFRTTTEPVTLRERWIVENGETMRLIVTNPKSMTEAARFDAVYHAGKRTAMDLQGGVRTRGVSAEFIEGLPHMRSSKGFFSALAQARILPASFPKERPKITNLNQIRPTSEPLVRLGRAGGSVSWVFGEPTPVGAKKSNPAVWIEQDAFVLKRIRFPSEAEVSIDEYNQYTGSLKLPRERTVTWDNNSVVIRTLSVRPISEAQAKRFLDPASLSAGDVPEARLPEQAQVREFYSRFR